MKTRKITAFIVTSLICLFLFGHGKSAELEMKVCGSYAVTGMFCEDLKGNEYKCKIMETDDYGRVLFSYSGYNIITGKDETATVICQKSGSGYVYYYEDICYVYQASEADIPALKEDNDWNKDLQYDKMTKRSSEITFDLCISTPAKPDYERALQSLCTHFDINESDISDLSLIDVGSGDREMYFLSVSRNGVTEKYCLIINADYEISYITIQEGEPLKDGIMRLKSGAGWYQ
ncbi:MAG: hypothetical protein IKM61_04025 [Eubacteriaceae bacterium]|nr:hypothetical protein [Eubacteriaceae bacterium]